MQESIKVLLQETITRAATSSLGDLRANQSTRRRKKLASFMGTLLEEMTKGIIHILLKHFYSRKLDFSQKLFFRQNKRISLLTLHFDEIFMLQQFEIFAKVLSLLEASFDLISGSSLSMKIQIMVKKITENLGFKAPFWKVKNFHSFFFSFSNSSHKSGYLLF